jgi:hypothetical protein
MPKSPWAQACLKTTSLWLNQPTHHPKHFLGVVKPLSEGMSLPGGWTYDLLWVTVFSFHPELGARDSDGTATCNPLR